jgi:superoxide dismutase
VEEFSDRLNKQYSSLEEMKNVFSKYNISIKGNNYFVKKAEIEIEEKLNQN